MDILDIKEQGLKDYQKSYAKMLSQSMQNTKEVIAGQILRRATLPKYKLHMHMKKDWRVLELREIEGRYGYFTHSSYKTHREAQAIMKLMEE